MAGRAGLVRRGPAAPRRGRRPGLAAQRHPGGRAAHSGRAGTLDRDLRHLRHPLARPRLRRRLGGAGLAGYAVPRLQARWSALTSGLVLGVLITGWHLPLIAVGQMHSPTSSRSWAHDRDQLAVQPRPRQCVVDHDPARGEQRDLRQLLLGRCSPAPTRPARPGCWPRSGACWPSSWSWSAVLVISPGPAASGRADREDDTGRSFARRSLLLDDRNDDGPV